ncbi:MAG TPA: hypothetical protein VIA18_20275 [Polyangia bacterium]|nr:hypothetical protein [Polyangia bacterium]
MKLASIRHFVMAGLVAAVAAASGCAYGPLDGSQVNPGDKLDWIGFTTAPNAVVDIQARWTDGNWYTYDTATAGSTDGNSQVGRQVFDRAIYQWSKDGSAIPAWAFNGANQAAVRAVQVSGSTQYPMWMFDTPGFNCLEAKFWAAYDSGTEMDTEGDDQTCSRATNGGQDRNFVTVHR